MGKSIVLHALGFIAAVSTQERIRRLVPPIKPSCIQLIIDCNIKYNYAIILFLKHGTYLYLDFFKCWRIWSLYTTDPSLAEIVCLLGSGLQCHVRRCCHTRNKSKLGCLQNKDFMLMYCIKWILIVHIVFIYFYVRVVL